MTFFPPLLCLVLRERTRSRERAGLWRSPVHPVSGTTVTGPAVSESQVWQPHFCTLSLSLTHTQTALFYLSGCCLLSVWLGSLCLSACPPHKPNNATLLGLLGLLRRWPPARWKKEEGNVMRRKGKWKVRKGEGRTWTPSLSHWNHSVCFKILGRGKGIKLWNTQHSCTHKASLDFSLCTQQPEDS